MNESRIFEVKATGYKPHLCSTEQQVEMVIRDIKIRRPQSECSYKVWELPYLYYDDEKPLVTENDYLLIDLRTAKIKVCIADFMSLFHNLNAAMEHPQDGLVYLTSTLYCSVLTEEQAQVLHMYLKDNYQSLKAKEDMFFETNNESLKKLDLMTEAFSGNGKKKTATVIN
jgi:hypothetical protein